MATRADIEINVKGLKKVQELSKQLDKVSGKVNQLNKTGGSKTEKQAANFEEKKAASMVRVRNIGDQIQRAKEAGLKTDKASRALNRAALANDKGKLKLARAHTDSALRELKAEQATTKEMANQLKFSKLLAATRSRGGGGGGVKPDKFNDRSNAAAARSGLISGAFPLLFGQGIAGGATGFAGGFIGTKMGGQMGGFAGGLVATAILQQVTQTVSAVGELGQALNPLTADLNKLTTAVGLAGTQEGLRLKILEETEGKQAALAAATQNMALVVGDAGVESLRTFGENFSAISNNFARFNTRMQAGFAELFNRVLELFPGLKGEGGASPAVNETVEGRLKNEPEAKELNTRISELKDEIVRLETAISNRTNPFIPKELTNFFKGGSTLFPSQMGTIDEGIAEKTDETKLNQTKDELKIEVDKLNVLKEQFTTEEKIKERKKTANSAQKAALSTTQKEIELLKAKLDGNFEEVQLNQEVDAIVQELLNKGILIEDINKKDIENQLNREKSLKKQVTQAKKLEDAFAQLSITIGNDIKNGIAGLIKGTSTLSDLLNNVADKFLDVALNQALFGDVLGAGGKKGGGILGFLTGGALANGGRAAGGKSFIVGEKGPELFVPKSSGTVVPNNKLGGGGSTSVVVNVDASGSDVQGDDAGAKELGTLISVAVQGELLKQQRPGGLLSSLR